MRIRRSADPEFTTVYDTAGLWRDAALGAGESILEQGRIIWDEETATDLHERFVAGADHGDESFSEKLQSQMQGASQESSLLMAELMLVHLLPLTNVTLATKLRNIDMIGSWAPTPFSTPSQFHEPLGVGLFNGGAGFNTGRPNHLRFLIRMVQRWSAFSQQERSNRLEDPWAFKDFLYELPTDGATSQRNALLLMLFPEVFEDISARAHKQKIAAAFPDLRGETSDIDRQILAIRAAKEAEFGKDFSWYGDVARKTWDKAKPRTKRSSMPSTAAEALEALLPEEQDRKLFATLVADTIETANAANEYSWSLSYRDRRLMLNVGPNRHLALVPDGLQLALQADSPELLTAALAEHGIDGTFRHEPFSFPGNTYFVTAPLDQARSYIAAASERHERATLATAERYTPYWKAHSAEALDLIRELTGRELPNLPERDGIASSDQRAWIIRVKRDDGKVDIAGSFDRSDVRIFWSIDVPPGSPLAAIKNAFRESDPEISNHSLGSRAGSVHRFITRVQPGDLVLLPDGRDLFFGTITSDAEYDTAVGEWSRSVEWQAEPIDRDEVTPALFSRLRSLLTITDITELFPEVLAYASGGSADGAAGPAAVAEVELAEIHDDLSKEWMLDRDWLQEIVGLLQHKRQLIFYGPPGTGKTYLAEKLAQHLTGDGGTYSLVQFHPSYSYEDFVEGFRPQADSDGNLTYALTPGPLKQIADAARSDPGSPYLLLIDEINRGNLAKIFGELYYLLEYRERSLVLQYGSSDEDEFSLPKNLFVIGTMNTADRSIAMVDAAIRRRFNFVEFSPTEKPISGLLSEWLRQKRHDQQPAALLAELNRRLDSSDYAIGPSYLMNSDASSRKGLERIWKYSIMPLLVERFYGQPEAIKRFALDDLLKAIAPQAAVEDQPIGASDRAEEGNDSDDD